MTPYMPNLSAEEPPLITDFAISHMDAANSAFKTWMATTSALVSQSREADQDRRLPALSGGADHAVVPRGRDLLDRRVRDLRHAHGRLALARHGAPGGRSRAHAPGAQGRGRPRGWRVLGSRSHAEHPRPLARPRPTAGRVLRPAARREESLAHDQFLAAPGGQDRDQGRQLRGVDGLGHVGVEPRLQRAEAVLGPRVGCEGERGDLAAFWRAERADLADQHVAVVAGHADVADENVRAPPPER